MATSRQPHSPGIPPLEWAVALAGFVLVSGALGVLVWLGLARGDTPPEIAVRVERITALANGYVVRIRAVNTGGTTAADVTVEGELRGAASAAETSSMTFKFLAPHSERRGGLFFEKDPRQFDLKVRPKGYEAP